MQFKLNSTTIERLKLYSQILKTSSDNIIQEALEKYFEEIEQNILEKNIEDEKRLTTFSNDEFWDGLDI